YLNSDDNGALEALFTTYHLEDWLALSHQLIKAMLPLGFLSSFIIKRQLGLEGLSHLLSTESDAYHQNQFFFSTAIQKQAKNEAFNYFLLKETLLDDPLTMTPVLADFLDDQTAVVLKNFKDAAGISIAELDPFNHEAFVKSDYWFTYLYPFISLPNIGKQLADFIYNALASSHHDPASLLAREAEVMEIFDHLPHQHLAHLLCQLFVDVPEATSAKVHKMPPAGAPRPKVSMILLDWECREYFQALHWLQKQTVPREDYELIWVELYNRVAPEAMELADMVVTCGQEGVYHKHKGYNEGLIRARGELITVCDSDAVFPPDFIASVIEAFELAQQPDGKPLVLMHHEGRSPQLYPDDKLKSYEEISRYYWVSLWPNAGACMTVRMRDALIYGGFDEHETYRGYICGPYELGWRLINAGIPQYWHESCFLWHFAHPHSNQPDNASDWNEIVSQHIEHHAADAVAAFSRGEMQPKQEHPVIFQRRMDLRRIGSKYERRYAWFNPLLLPTALGAAPALAPSVEHEGPLVSAIVTTYRSERFMRSLLEDLEQQTIADQLEIVIVDSNSPEHESEIVAEFMQKYSNIVYVKTEKRENSHVSLNQCIQMAKGKYITLANTDDRHVPDAFERMVAAMEARPDVALVYADIAVTKNEEDITLNRPLDEAEVVAYYRWPEFSPVGFFAQCYAGPQPMWRRSVHDRHGYFDPEFWSAGDYEFWLRLVAGGELFLHLPAVLGIMLLTSSSNSNMNIKLSQDEGLLCRQRYWPRHWGKMPKPEAAHMYLPEIYNQGQPENYPSTELVSVLIRVDRRPDLLLESLASIMGQNYPSLELLILNASEVDVERSLQNMRLPAVTIFNARGMAPELARNLCLKMASGRYVFYINSGDRWHGNHLLTHLKALADHTFVYSEAFRLPQRQTNAFLERLARDVNNTPDFNQSTVMGHFVATTAMSHHRSLVDSLPLYPEFFSSEAELERWRELEAMRRAELFASQAWRYQDWDLQLLAAGQLEPLRLRTVTCEYVEAEQVPDSPQGLAERIKASATLMAQDSLEPQVPDLSLVIPLRNQGGVLNALLEDVVMAVPEDLEAELVMIDQGSGDQTPGLLNELSGDIRTLRLLQSVAPLELLRKGLGAASGRRVVLLRDPAALKGFDALPEEDGIWSLSGSEWIQLKEPNLEANWYQYKALAASAPSWKSWLLDQSQAKAAVK
ncbi:MAG TPA: glycosyltransferase, partial [Candidatus Obscuribacterales bacterium]